MSRDSLFAYSDLLDKMVSVAQDFDLERKRLVDHIERSKALRKSKKEISALEVNLARATDKFREKVDDFTMDRNDMECIFDSLRDNRKCGQCMYKIVCVGSGTRVYAVGGDGGLNKCRIVDVGATAFVFSSTGLMTANILFFFLHSAGV